MKSLFLLSIIFLFTSSTFGQTIVDVAKTQKTVKTGSEITIFEAKPLTGYLTENYPNGKQKSWITMKEGFANGLWQEWYENGQLKYSAFWLDGKGHGSWKYFHENGRLRQDDFYDMDIPIGLFFVYYDNGQLKSKGGYLKGKKQGIWEYHNENGTLQKLENYNDGKLIGNE